MQRVCVYCGSSPGRDPAYREAAVTLVGELAQRGLGVVYGGAHVGLMGVVADSALAAGAEVIGVIPQGLVDREIAHTGLTDLRVVGSMHERKAQMAELADAFVALPGGLGTLEELFEVAHLVPARPAPASRAACSTCSATTTGWRRCSTTRSPSASCASRTARS